MAGTLAGLAFAAAPAPAAILFGSPLCSTATPPCGSSIIDSHGAAVPFTATTTGGLIDPNAQLAVPFTPGSVGDVLRQLGEPFTAALTTTAARGVPGSTNDPEDDLDASLADLAAAPDATAAQAAIAKALGILDGTTPPLAADVRAYSGIPLLNYDAPTKVQDVAANATVTVRIVRFGDHEISDTWLLNFLSPGSPFKIKYEISELGTAFGGELSPVPLLQDDVGPIGGQPSTLQPLAPPNLDLGTNQANRFQAAPASEMTRLAIQDVTVDMPAPNLVQAILDPDLRPGHEAMSVLMPSTPDRVAAATAVFGAAPRGADKAQAIGALGILAPEKQIWTDLQAADPVADLAAAKQVGTDDQPLVAEMRVRDEIPPGIATDPAADVNVALVNNETYVDTRNVRLAPGAALKVHVTNADNFTHDLQMTQLSNRVQVLGATDWGRFDWSRVLNPTALAPGADQTFVVTVNATTRELVIGDPDHGDQASTFVNLDRGPLRESIHIGPDGAAPLHILNDADGNTWVTLVGIDSIYRLRPVAGQPLSSAHVDVFPLPGGNPNPTSLTPNYGPLDIKIDGHGIMWVTLPVGNAIARIDPSQVVPGQSNGISIIDLDPCPDCRLPPPPVLPGPLTRSPQQLRLYDDGNGNTVMWFTELDADRIGVLRVSPQGNVLNQAHFQCACTFPAGIAIDSKGAVYFAAPGGNFVGRITPNQTNPYDANAAHQLDVFRIKSQDTFIDPAFGTAPITTGAPHSLAIDRHDRIWFTLAATNSVGFLDPAAATPGTTNGMHEVILDRTDFGRLPVPADLTVDRAGEVFVADEYGDRISLADVAGGEPVDIGGLRPTARQSLTDSPQVDPQGNLWFIEGGAGLVTRISAVSAGLPAPAAPPSIVADTGAGTVTGSGLAQSEMSSVDVEVLRGGNVVTGSLGVPLVGGAFAVGGDGTPWGLHGAPLLQGDDVVRITPHGPVAPAPFSFKVADLQPAIGADGALHGTALENAKALSDFVVVSTGGTSGPAPIGAADGVFNYSPPLPLDFSSFGTVSWGTGTPAARFRTVTPFGTPPAPQPQPQLQPQPQPQPSQVTGVTPGPGDNPAAIACEQRHWLTSASRGHAAKFNLLGLSRSQLESCLGKPTSASGAIVTWKGVLQARIGSKGVVGYTLLGRTFRGTPQNVGVGSSLAALQRALNRRTGRAGSARRAVVRSAGRNVDVRITLRGGRATRIEVRVRTKLDAAGRRLVGAHL